VRGVDWVIMNSSKRDRSRWQGSTGVR
jgi:hypothetical protein